MSNMEVFENDNIEDLYSVNAFTEGMLGIIQNLAEKGKTFSLKSTKKQEASGVFDLLKMKNPSGETLGSALNSIYEGDTYQVAVYRYLLDSYACYVEVPTRRVRGGIPLQAYDKFIATSNIFIVANWLNEDPVDADKKYGSRIDYVNDSIGLDTTPYVKLYEKSGGIRAVTRPRKDLDLTTAGMRVIPLIFLQKYTDVLLEKVRDGFVEIVFEKDNGQLRKMVTTLNKEKLEEIYGDSWTSEALYESFDGNWNELPSLTRGYIKLPEIGSIYDSPTRSLNFARINKVDYEPVVDLTFVNVDINAVLDEFKTFIINNAGNQSYQRKLANALETFGFDKPQGGWQSSSDFLDWADSQAAVLTTEFYRNLHTMMVSVPSLFPNYTGEREDLDSVFEWNGASSNINSLGSAL